MKKLSILLLLMPFTANAYVSQQGGNPKANPEYEYKIVKRSLTSGLNDQILKGHIVSYDTTNNVEGGYIVTRVGANTALGAGLQACVATRNVPTGDVSYFPCITRGYVDYLRWSATTAFSVGQGLCANSDGVAVVCAPCVNTASSTNDCRYGDASSKSGVIALEAETGSSGSNLKARVQFKQ